MKYTILTLGNPEREPYRQGIRDQMDKTEEVFVDCVNGKDLNQLNAAIDRYRFPNKMEIWRPGEGGVWYSTINAWQWAVDNDEDLMVFEDDAVLHHTFGSVVQRMPLPDDYDFITYYVPFNVPMAIGPVRLVPNYQEHGNVCVQYSVKGAEKILNLLADEGLEWPVDIWLYKKANAGQLSGWAPKPTSRKIVDVDYKVPTNIHEDDRIQVHNAV